VFLNYLLDCLPAAVLRCEGGDFRQLHARTTLPACADWKALTRASRAELLQLANSPDDASRHELLAVYPLVTAEYEYRPVLPGQVPIADFVLPEVRLAEGKPVLHNHGALASLEALLGVLHEDGLILINDYGQTKEVTAEDFEHQRFSLATFVGINFPLLGRYFSADGRACWREPSGDDASLHARLLTHKPQPSCAARFEACYGEQALRRVEEPAQRARELVKAGRFQAALGQYREALSRQPFSWVLMNEAANFLTFGLQNPQAGLAMARAALEHNPACSAELSNTLGDALFALGRVGEAPLAFDRALAVNPDDVRARLNLAFAHAAAREYREALVRLAEALALDRPGAYREGLLQKQAEVLQLLDQQSRHHFQGQIDRVVGAGPATGAPSPPASSTALPTRGAGDLK
jgi:tetratricopeptide (TPR) repeat protein